MKMKYSNQLGSLSMKISAFVVGIALVCFIINSVMTIRTAYNNAESEIYNKISISMQSATDQIDASLKLVESITNTMAIHGFKNEHDDNEINKLLYDVLSSCPAISAVTLEYAPYAYSPDLKEYAPSIYLSSNGSDTIYENISLRGLHYQNPEYCDENWLLSVKGERCWCRPYISVGDHVLRESYSAPIYRPDGKLFAVLCSTVTLDWIKDAFEATKPGERCEVKVITQTGDYIYNSSKGNAPFDTLGLHTATKSKVSPYFSPLGNIKEDSIFLCNKEVNGVIQQMLQGHEGNTKVGKPLDKYFYYMPIQTAGWSVCYIYPMDLIRLAPLELAKNMLWQGLSILLLMFLVLSVGIYYLIKPFTNNLKRVTEINAEMNRDLQIASKLQVTMLPIEDRKSLGCNQMELHGQLTPAKMVGGDLYEYFNKHGKFYFCIGDISGKGVPASMYMAIVQILIHEISDNESEVDRIIAKLNQSLTRREGSMFCTLFLGAIDLATGRVECCNAGHNPPILVRQLEQALQAEYLHIKPGGAVGVFSDEEYNKEEIVLQAGDALFLYTDGVTEAENIEHQLFGEQATLQTICSCAATDSVEDIVNHVLHAVNKHAGSAEQSDDITMLMLRYQPTDQLQLTNDVSQTSMLGEWVEVVCNRYGIPNQRLFNIQLGIEEAVVNVMSYAYGTQKNMPIYLSVHREEDGIAFYIEDEGVPFNPTQQVSPQFDLKIEDCPIGGLGVFLYTELLDGVEYKYENNRNKLILSIKQQTEDTVCAVSR